MSSFLYTFSLISLFVSSVNVGRYRARQNTPACIGWALSALWCASFAILLSQYEELRQMNF